MKDIPGFDVELAQATDYILGSPLAKRAFINPPFHYFTNIVTEIIRWIDRLADNCHMPEFTNHALPHICSMVKRASEWGESDGWLNNISSQEAGYLLIALLIHDIGMLSQDSRDIPENEKLQHMKGLSDVSGWVRRTHVIRIENLVRYLLKDYLEIKETKEELSIHLDIIVGMAQSHAKWPWDPDFVTKKVQIADMGLKEERIGALNAVIAVCDLLDEDSDRCDTLTLIKHRYGTTENKSHWIRHALTKHVDGVRNHRITVWFRRLTFKSPCLDMLYRVLRNHYRLVKLYQERLAEIHGEIQRLDFEPGDGIPEEEDEISRELSCCYDLPEFQYDLIPHLLATFMKEARNQDGGDRKLRKRLDGIGLENIDMAALDEFFHPGSLLYPEERVIFGKGTTDEKIKYAYGLAEKAYVNGEIEKLRHICGAVLKKMDPRLAEPGQVYWALTYLLVYERGSIDFDAAEGMHQNRLLLNFRAVCKDIPEVNSPGRPYQGLLDVLFCFLIPHITSDAMKLYQDYLLKYDYANLKDDFATMVLVRTVVGLFWFWDRESGAWREISAYIRRQVREDSQVGRMLNIQQKCLSVQDKILYGREEVTEEELTDTDYPVLARAWKHFFRADWQGAAKDIGEMISCAEKTPDLFGAVQGFQNMTSWTIELNGADKGAALVSDRETGVRRYQRNTAEQGRAEFWHSRESEIEISLAENRVEPTKGSNADKRANVLRLISLRKLEALQYWDLGEYMESVRNEARWFYDLAVYEDEYGTYQGTPGYLPEAVITSIQSLDSGGFTKEEMHQLTAKMYYHFPEGYEEIVRFLTSNPQKCIWIYGIQWLEYLIMDLESGQLGRVLKWIVEKYDPFIRTQKHHFDLGEYEFLWQAAYRFSVEDWGTVFPLVKGMFEDYSLYRPNQKLAQNSLNYMPISLCEEALGMIEKWPSGQGKRNVVYESCISLSKRWGDRMRESLHRFVHTCQAADPCRVYQELDQLIDVNNLLERKDMDTEGICQAAEEAMKELENKNLTGYDSRYFSGLKEKFTNQNWHLMPEEKVLAIVRGFCRILTNHEELSKGYFMDICTLLNQISRIAEKSVRHVLLAWENLEQTDQWFGEEKFARLAGQDTDYQEMFQKPVRALMKKAGSSEIRHWGEKKGMAAEKRR